ncbi:MAG TPA: TlpA disulfide reductase family protein [Parasegetibacter sp.]
MGEPAERKKFIKIIAGSKTVNNARTFTSTRLLCGLRKGKIYKIEFNYRSSSFKHDSLGVYLSTDNFLYEQRKLPEIIPSIWVRAAGNEFGKDLTVCLDNIVVDSVPFGAVSLRLTKADLPTNAVLPESLVRPAFRMISINRVSDKNNTKVENHSEFLSFHKEFNILFGDIENKNVVIFDHNNNLDFSDDIAYNIGVDSHYIPIRNVQVLDGSNTDSVTFYVKPEKSSLIIISTNLVTGEKKQIIPPIDEELKILVPFRTGTISVENEVYRAALFNYHLNGSYRNKMTSLIITAQNTPFKPASENSMQYGTGDTIFLKNHKYVFDQVNETGSKVLLRFAGYQDNNLGFDEGNYSFDITGEDLLTEQSISFLKSNKYTLIDFWGTWCGPCLQFTPQIKELYNSIDSSKCQIVGIAVDKNPDVVKTYLMQNEIKWPVIFDAKANPKIATRFNIKLYPLFLLIDPHGKILIRGSSQQTFNSIRRIMLETIRK